MSCKCRNCILHTVAEANFVPPAGFLMKDAVTPAVRRAAMPWEDNVASVTTPARSVLMRGLTAAPAVTQVWLKYTLRKAKASIKTAQLLGQHGTAYCR